MGEEKPVRDKLNNSMEYFIIKDRSQQGPYTREQLAEAGLTSGTLVWREGMEHWTPAWQMEELKDILAGRSAARTAPPPPPPHDEEAAAPDDDRKETGTEPTGNHGDKRRRRAAVRLAVAAAVFFALLITCPSEEKHQEAVGREISAALTDGMGRPDTGSTVIDALGGMFGSAITAQIVNVMIGQTLTVDDYFIFSVGRLHYDGKDKTVSLGVLGHVFTFDSDDIRDAVDGNRPTPDTMAV